MIVRFSDIMVYKWLTQLLQPWKKVKEMIRRRLIFGDLHGSYKALMQCLERTDFRPEKDVIYSVGDIADGYPDVYECLSFLKELPTLTYMNVFRS